ncbi:MAG: HAMP domain-containing sensor histidine kinase [Pirellulaceae bacterium]
MFERRSLRLPITLGVVMIVLLVVLLVGWVLLTVFGALADDQRAGLYWALLSIGATLLAFVLVGVVMYLTLTIKAINLSRRQSNFIDSVTHELKSPIASLKLYLQTLNRRHLSAEEQEGFYKYMLEDVERLDSLINHLLDAARLQKDRTPPEAEDVNLAGVIRGTAQVVCLRHQMPPDIVQFDLVPCTVRAAPVDLELIFRNLIDNAVKFANDEDPRIEVSLQPDGDGRLLARISDNGRGIPQQSRRQLFSRFMRLGSELERDKPGTGLGLYIVRTLVTRLGGTIRIRDAQQGPGTMFEVQLPGQPLAGPVEADEPSEPATPASR